MNEKECPWYKKLYKTLFYDTQRKFLSRTALMNFIFFMMAVSLFVVAIVAYIVWGKTIPSNIFVFVGGLTGGGFLQYSFGKKLANGHGTEKVE